MLAMSLSQFIRAFVGTFFIGENDPKQQTVFLCITWFAWFPLSVLAIFARRISALLMLCCAVSGFVLNRSMHYRFSTPTLDRIWLIDSTAPLAISAVVLLAMDIVSFLLARSRVRYTRE